MVHPLPIASAAATILAGIFLPVLTIPLGLVWLISVGALAARRGDQRQLPDISHLPPSLQADLLEVTNALDQLQDAVRSVPEEQRPMFEGVIDEAEEVRESVLNLGVRAGAVHRHIEQMHAAETEDDLREHRERLKAAEDDSARRQIEASIAELEGRIERRDRLMNRLERYRGTIRSLESSAIDLADRAVDLAAGAPMEYDSLDERSPERKMSQMKASVAALEEVMRADTELI